MALLAGLLWAPGLGAQEIPQSAVLTIDADRFYAQSAFGQRVAADMRRAEEQLAAENRAIEAELSEEEQRLTEKRDGLTPEEFRALADAFDLRVQEIRQIQTSKAVAIERRAEEERRRFIGSARPILAAIMQSAQASVIVEKRSVLASRRAIDVTDVAVARANRDLGDGAQADDTNTDAEN